MAVKAKRVRKAATGFVGINLVKDGDLTLLKRVKRVIKKNPEANMSSLSRAALNEYLDRHYPE